MTWISLCALRKTTYNFVFTHKENRCKANVIDDTHSTQTSENVCAHSFNIYSFTVYDDMHWRTLAQNILCTIVICLLKYVLPFSCGIVNLLPFIFVCFSSACVLSTLCIFMFTVQCSHAMYSRTCIDARFSTLYKRRLMNRKVFVDEKDCRVPFWQQTHCILQAKKRKNRLCFNVRASHIHNTVHTTQYSHLPHTTHHSLCRTTRKAKRRCAAFYEFIIIIIYFFLVFVFLHSGLCRRHNSIKSNLSFIIRTYQPRNECVSCWHLFFFDWLRRHGMAWFFFRLFPYIRLCHFHNSFRHLHCFYVYLCAIIFGIFILHWHAAVVAAAAVHTSISKVATKQFRFEIPKQIECKPCR